MYSFRIKADAADINVPAIRALAGTAVIFCLLYRQQHSVPAGIMFTALTFIVLLFIQALLVKYKVNPLVLAGVVSVFVFLATHAFIFPIIIFLIMVAIKMLYVHPVVEIDGDGVSIKKTLSAKKYSWQNFGNIVLKDNLLTLDFKNNKVLQLEADGSVQVNEKQFNEFCSQKITQ